MFWKNKGAILRGIIEPNGCVSKLHADAPMKKIFTLSQLFLAALLLAALPCQAQHAAKTPAAPNTPKIPKQRENRFLFVVDTSSAMRDYSDAVMQGVTELLTSDMRGEFRPGDTIGLWTYNDKLHPEFPMQVWSKANKAKIVADMATYLRYQRYASQGHLGKVMPALNQIIKHSERITVVLIFDGDGAIRGTPFDKDISILQKKYAPELRVARVPFVMVLAARDGAVFDYTINYPGLVAIPHTANSEPPAETKAPVAAIAMPVTNAPAKPRPTHSFIMLAATNLVIQNAPPAPVAPPPSAPLVVVTATVTPLPVASGLAPAPVSQPTPAATTPTQTQPVPAPIVARQNPEPDKETPAQHSPSATAPADDRQPTSVAPVARNAPMANIAPAGGAQVALFIIAISLLTIAVVLVVFLVRRSRNSSEPSLISQSIDRPR
jgi:hypothetical protein